MYNESVDLEKLDNGDLIYQIDFRDVYTTILKKWLNANPEIILKNKFNRLDFV